MSPSQPRATQRNIFRLMRSKNSITILGWITTVAILNRFFGLPVFHEPDRFFHLALVKETIYQQKLFITTWSQFPLLGWDQYFSDKEFLFHFILKFFVQALSDQGANLFLALVSSSIFWIPVLIVRSPLMGALLSLTIYLNPFIFFRYSILRPHVLASLLLLSFFYLITIKKRRAWLLGALYSLAYHAFYIPFLLAVAIAANKKSSYLKTCFWSAFGVIAGIVINPYFPSNIFRSLQHALVALNIFELSNKLHLRFGEELMPISINQYLLAYSGILGALFITTTIEFLIQKRRSPLLYLICAIWLVAWKSPRLIDLFIPITILQILLVSIKFNTKQKVVLIAIPALSSILNLSSQLEHFNEANMSKLKPFEKMISDIPLDSNARIFYTDWSVAPMLVYLRPNAQVVDVLDPTYLYFSNPKLSQQIYPLANGEIADPANTIKSEFGATYAITENSPLLGQLLQSDGATFIDRLDKKYFLFKLK